MLPEGGAASTGASSTAGSTSEGSTGDATEMASSSSSAGSSDGGTAEASSGGDVACVDAHELVIPIGAAVVVDGSAPAGEWDDAAQYGLTPTLDWSVPVGIKHDSEGLLVVFAQIRPPAPPPVVAFPELMIDVGNDKSRTLGPDDWWFHVSATDCHGTGEYDNYRTCVAEAEGWEANNFPAGSLIDLVEIRIDFATIGIDPTVEQDLGLLLRLSDTQGWAAHWPADGNPDAPSTWATVHLCP
jgi:hypothetical protein